ncbi:MAG: formate dehydrogenase subunit gamma [Pseudomonadota bacterium]
MMAKPWRKKSLTPRRRIVAWSLFVMVFCLLAIPMGLSLYSDIGYAATAQEQSNPRANFWRAVRQGSIGYSAVKGQEANVLIQSGGQNWRQVRNGWLIPYSGYLLIAMIALFALYFMFKGRIPIEGGRSGKEITRTTSTERWIHWFTAVVFILLALTGLILLYGRTVLIPIMGPEAFAAMADVGITVHNYLGVLFILAMVLTIISFFRDSLFNLKVDMTWFSKAGGYLGGSKPSSEKYNAGQKAWYWTVVIMGVILCVTGLILDFPNLEQNRGTMQLANIIHVLASAIVIAFFLVHIYLAAIGIEGALEAMISGKVDENWVKQHHDLWYEELQKSGQRATAAEGKRAANEARSLPDSQTT